MKKLFLYIGIGIIILLLAFFLIGKSKVVPVQENVIPVQEVDGYEYYKNMMSDPCYNSEGIIVSCKG